MTPLTPPVNTIKAFERPIDKVDSPTIEYPNLSIFAAGASQAEAALWREFIATETDSLEEDERARALARGYLVLTSYQLQQAAERHRPAVSQRFTEATMELYGAPQPTAARQILINQIEELSKAAARPGVDHQRLMRLLIIFNIQTGPYRADELTAENQAYKRVFSGINQALQERYGRALSVFDDIDADQDCLSGEQLKQLFEKANYVLAETDPAWQSYGFDLVDKESCQFNEATSNVEIGRFGKYRLERAVKLYLEEVLVHQQRRNNGASTGNRLLAIGMRGNGETEEGLAKVFQVAMGEKLNQKTEDLYLDTALALGTFGQPPLNRAQIASIYFDRSLLRTQIKGKPVDLARLYHNAWRHANRIFRGSLGNEHIAVNTKDIGYYAGFLKMREYIRRQLDAGVDTLKLIDFLLGGKFDPTDRAQVELARPFSDGELIDQLV